MSQYVCARITRMDEIDVALFERDWNNTLYYFILNADEQIYMRYGGRDSRSPDSYLSLSSLELALQKGLELHSLYQNGALKKAERPKPLYPREIAPLVERTFERRACVECHLIGDFQNIQREREGRLDKLAHMYRSPDIAALGIRLDVPKGLVVKEVEGAAETAGMKPGDRIAALNGTAVWTFGDLQYHYDRLPRSAARVQMRVDRNGAELELSITLPPRWWWTDLTFRQSSVEPRVYFDSRPLTAAEKKRLELASDGFASEVTSVDSLAEMLKSHQLHTGDIIYSVDGTERDTWANTAELFIKLQKKAGEAVMLGVIRDGKRIQMKLKTYILSFRK